jgi:copper chaperone NosL
MKNLCFISILFFTLFLVSCSTGPEPIAYGHDGCAYCEMTIMDQRYGTELVTTKGKIFKFDSVECLVKYFKDGEVDQQNVKLVLLTPFNHPETLEDANHSYILHSQGLPSPMGMFLTAFKDEATAKKFQQETGGTIYTWQELLDKFENLL